MNWPLTILLANFASTWFLVGLIWMVQVVHYPLFDGVGEKESTRYQQRHQNAITFIVGPVMLAELVSAILLIWFSPEHLSGSLVIIGIILVAVIWISTALVQVPCHEKLSKGFDSRTHRWLFQTNWIRTIAWSSRGMIVMLFLAQVLSSN